MSTTPQPGPSSRFPFIVLIVKLYWIAAVHVGVLLTAIVMYVHDGTGSFALNAVVLFLALSAPAARILDFRLIKSETVEGEVTTTRHVVGYTVKAALVHAGLWVSAHAGVRFFPV